MKFLTLTSLILFTVLVATPRPVKANNLLTNPGFETGDFTGWTVSANTMTFGVQSAGFVISNAYGPFGPFPVIVNSGTFAAYAITCNFFFGACNPTGDSGDNLTLSQTVNLVAGDTYSIGFEWGSGNSAEVGGFGNSSNITVNGTPIAFTSFPRPIVEGYQLEDGTFTATANGPATVAFFLQGSGYGDAGFSFDDFFVNAPSAVPEPSSLLLLGSGLIIGLAGALRRKIAG